MFPMNWQLTADLDGRAPPVVWALRYYSDRTRKASNTIQERESGLLATTQEGLGSIRIVQAFGHGLRSGAIFAPFHGESRRQFPPQHDLNDERVGGRDIDGPWLSGDARADSLQLLQGDLSLGDLLVFVAYLATLYQPIERLTYTARALEGATAGAQRCFEVLDHQEQTKDAPGAVNEAMSSTDEKSSRLKLLKDMSIRCNSPGLDESCVATDCAYPYLLK